MIAHPRLRDAPAWVFAILLGSYAFFWHSRDWNTASRLMLTYALVDRGTLRIDGLERQTGDEAWVHGHYYSDKGPGFSILAVPPSWLTRVILGLPAHPIGKRALKFWPADYWVTLGTSSLATAALGALLTWLSTRLGCGPRQSALIGLSYGLGTPAYVYATLAYGHQVAASALLASYALIATANPRPGSGGLPGWWSRRRTLAPALSQRERVPESTLSPRERVAVQRPGEGPPTSHADLAILLKPGSASLIQLGAAGFLAAFAAVIELQAGPVSAILGLHLLARRPPMRSIVAFAVGAIVPTLLLLGYNDLAFGSPLEMGYAHHVIPEFRRVHGRGNPLGIGPPDWSKVGPLLWGRYRGLLFYAPILILAVPGWFALIRARRWGVALVSASACLAVFLVNLSYPEWTGGWSTGPRLLVILLPFAMLPVAASLRVGGRWLTGLAIVLALGGGLLILLFQGVGGRIPQDFADPLGQVVGPLWRGDPLPFWREGLRFEPTLISILWPAAARSGWQFVPLLGFQALTIAAMLAVLRPPGRTAGPTPASVGSLPRRDREPAS